MTDRSNTAAALDFLKTIKERKDKEAMDTSEEEPPPLNAKPVFKRPKKKSGVERKEEDTEDKPSFVGAKTVMPEYVVGAFKPAKKKGEKKTALNTSTSGGGGGKSKALKLSHLDEEEEEEEG